jgi:hypothetical protein
MKMKKVLYVVLTILLIYLICCFNGPAVIHIERTSTINAPIDSVKSCVLNYNVFKEWSPWAEKDPTMKITVEGEAGKVGHKYSWEGNKLVGKGTMEITSVGNDTVLEKLVFVGRGESDVVFAFKPDGAGTNIVWTMDMNVGFFGRGMMMFMKGDMDKDLGKDFELGLQKLKTLTEAKSNTPKKYQGYEVKELNWDEKTYLGKKANVAIDELSNFLANIFSILKNEFKQNKIECIGGPSALYFTYNEFRNKTECAAVYGVAKGTTIKGLEKFVTPASKVLQIIYFGAFNSKMKAPHLGMEAYMKEKGLTQTLVIEEYITTQVTEKDTAKWQTNIYYMVK